MTTNNINAPKPGYSIVEEKIMHKMLDSARLVLQNDNWEDKLPFEITESYILELTSNKVDLTMYIKNRKINRDNIHNLRLGLKIFIKGNENNKWTYSDGGIILFNGNRDIILKGILDYEYNLDPLKEKLFEDYYATFYN